MGMSEKLEHKCEHEGGRCAHILEYVSAKVIVVIIYIKHCVNKISITA